MEYVLGFFIGLLCGAVPLLFGIFTKHKVLGIVGIAVTALSGILFVVFGRSAFTSICIAAVFLIFNFAIHKKKNQENSEHDEHDEHDDDQHNHQ